jgi:hypothetical protein
VFFKENIYKNNLYTSEELKQNTKLCISDVTAKTLYQVASNMKEKVNSRIAQRGGHFRNLM